VLWLVFRLAKFQCLTSKGSLIPLLLATQLSRVVVVEHRLQLIVVAVVEAQGRLDI
jgi:hypothetical protein